MISLQRMDRHHFAWLSIAAAVSTIALKTLAWWITGSVGLLSDALESFVNLAGASFALWMILVTRAPTASTPSATARPSISRAASRAS
jgi:divalent metal cation (Fe/Co/Zn/Cd) transporter